MIAAPKSGPINPAPNIERIAYRIDEVADALGVSRRTIERERSAGRFPQPARYIGKVPLWSREALELWIAEGGRPRATARGGWMPREGQSPRPSWLGDT